MARDNAVGFADLLTQMKITNRLLAAQIRSTLQQNEVIALLASTGASNREIAEVLDTSAAVVTTTLNRLRKKTR